MPQEVDPKLSTWGDVRGLADRVDLTVSCWTFEAYVEGLADEVGCRDVTVRVARQATVVQSAGGGPQAGHLE